MGKAIKWLVKHEWLALIWAGVIFLRIPNLFEPYWYGDEAIYLVIGQAINKGVSLYSQIHDNKPPLLYLTAAISGGYLFWFKFLAMVWNLATIWVFTKTAALAAGAMIPILLSLVFYYFQGSGKEYLTAAWLQNLPYLSSWKAGSGGTGIYSIKARLLILAGALAAITVGARRI